MLLRVPRVLPVVLATVIASWIPTELFAGGLDLSFTARAEAGLDPATREFLTSLPDIWRPKLNAIVNDTMTRVDQSFTNYVQQVDKLISDQVIDIQCHVVAAEHSVVDDIVSRFPLAAPGGSLEKLQNQFALDNKRRNDQSTPNFVKTLYADHATAASIAACQAGGVVVAMTQAKTLMADASGKWIIWNRIESLHCQTAKDCASSYRDQLNVLMRDSDSRDMMTARAQKLLDQDKPPTQSGWWPVNKIEFDQLENYMTQLYFVENAIGGAKAVRESLAISKLIEAQGYAKDGRDQLNASIASVKSRMVLTIGPFIGKIQIPCASLYPSADQGVARAARLLNAASADLKEAITLSNYVEQDSNTLLQEVNGLLPRTLDANHFCAAI
jgi:hypothetical protein